MTSSLWLIGSGPMACAYAAVLKAQNIPFSVIGRGRKSADSFFQTTGVPVFPGGLELALRKLPPPTQAIVAVGLDQLPSVSIQLIEAGCLKILLEKPGALYLDDLNRISTKVQQSGTQVWIAYNRRFYSSVQRLLQLVASDGGITSASFEFTEWSHRIRLDKVAPAILERWILANSSHVLDLAFFLIGLPLNREWHSFHAGSIDWHPSSARFHGAGLTERGITFSYQADWEAPGRWGLELLTRQRRYILRPLERLQAIPIGSVDPQPILLDDSMDQTFKPGLYLQCHAFVSGNTEHLCSLSDHIEAMKVYVRIAGYNH